MESSSISNKEKIESILQEIKKLGFHIIDKNTGNCYFVFKGNDDSICHFHIKEIPGFLFAFWTIDRFDTLDAQKARNTILWCDSLDIDTKSELVFFTQYERDLDKFKPSRSGFVCGLYRDSWEEQNDNGQIIKVEKWSNLYELERILKYMKKHHIRSVEYAGCQTRYIWDDDRTWFTLLIQYIKDWCYTYKSRFKEWYKYKKAIRVSKRYMKKLKQFNYIIRDEGKGTYPRIDIQIRRKEIITNKEQYEKDWDLINWFDNKFFNLISINWRQYEIDETSDAEIKNKDKKEREFFFYLCYTWINNTRDAIFDDEKLIAYSVESIPDIDIIVKKKELELKKYDESSNN